VLRPALSYAIASFLNVRRHCLAAHYTSTKADESTAGDRINLTPEIPQTEIRPDIRAGIVKRFKQIAIVFAIQATLLFVAAGRIDWTWAWVFLGISLVSVLINGTILLRTSPETIAERGRAKETKNWDKIVAGLYSLFLFLLLPLVAGLDTRFGWTGEISSTWNIMGAAVLAIALGLSGWAMIVNAYFSTAVRIQSDRGQTVCRTGPYRFVRHPGYVGFIFQSFATPVLLGSAWGLMLSVAAAAILIIRTSLEDRTLQLELPGYKDYAHEVRYRLVPRVW
jgi:protein-S-isoprenylcysteine O-methyltransferase Ste14